MARRYLLAGGGTGGHVTPLLAIAACLNERDPTAEFLFCGTARGIEKEIVEKAGYRFAAIRARGLPRKPSLELLRAVIDYRAGRQACRRLMREWQPDAVIGSGGYVCGPVISAAASLKIPILLHEQNAFPGRVNRLLARKSQVVCLSFPGSERYFPAGVNVRLTGLPLRPEFFTTTVEDSRAGLDLREGEQLILIMGASSGARSINTAALDLARRLKDRPNAPRLVLLAGKRQFAEYAAAAAGLPDLDVYDYLHDVVRYMAAADVLILRAGASSCMEAAALGKCAVLVPYPYAAGDHQTANARVLTDRDAAILCPDSELDGARLDSLLSELLSDPERRAAMGERARPLARPDAAQAICEQLQGILRR